MCHGDGGAGQPADLGGSSSNESSSNEQVLGQHPEDAYGHLKQRLQVDGRLSHRLSREASNFAKEENCADGARPAEN